MIPLLLTVSAAAQEVEVTDNPIADIVDETEIGGGMASYYGNELAGNRTASGERFDPAQLTAAHRSLPFGSLVRVTNTSNGDSVVVRINDRGPFAHGRVIDVSTAAAREIGMHRSGTARVKLALLSDD
jgi:rare lipoprotein A